MKCSQIQGKILTHSVHKTYTRVRGWYTLLVTIKLNYTTYKLHTTVRHDRSKVQGLWLSYLVADDPPTHLVILLTTSGVVDPLTATSSGSSPTRPVWGGDLPPHRWTLLRGVGHVEVSYTSPATWPTTKGLVGSEERYYWLSKQSLCRILDLISCYSSLFLRGAGLAAISLQDLGSVGEGESSVGSLGNSWLS